MGARRFDERDEGPHADAGVEEWLFTSWLADGSVGVVSGYRMYSVGGSCGFLL
jgi:hypothetical protein